MISNIYLVWILDQSKSMKAKGKINSINMVIREIIPLISELSQIYSTYNFFIRALAFSTDAYWIDAQFKKIQEYSWNDLEAKGRSDLGAAFKKVMEIQQREPQSSSDSNIFIFVLVTDGYPTDDWFSPLQNLRSHKIFTESHKIAIAIHDTEQEILKEFIRQTTPDKRIILGIDDIEQIPRRIISIIEH